MTNLRKLRSIEILSGAKLSGVEQDLSALKACYDLTSTELKNSPICPHCGFNMDRDEQNVSGKPDEIEVRIATIIEEWTHTLLSTVMDPIALKQKKYLTPEQQRIIDNFISSGKLPKLVDDDFVNTIKVLLRGFVPVVIDTNELLKKLGEIGPCDIATFKNKVNYIIDDYVGGKDLDKLRIVVKKKDEEV